MPSLFFVSLSKEKKTKLRAKPNNYDGKDDRTSWYKVVIIYDKESKKNKFNEYMFTQNDFNERQKLFTSPLLNVI